MKQNIQTKHIYSLLYMVLVAFLPFLEPYSPELVDWFAIIFGSFMVLGFISMLLLPQEKKIEVGMNYNKRIEDRPKFLHFIQIVLLVVFLYNWFSFGYYFYPVVCLMTFLTILYIAEEAKELSSF